MRESNESSLNSATRQKKERENIQLLKDLTMLLTKHCQIKNL